MSEYEDAVALANRVLDRISADPDDDLAILARQFLRARERELTFYTRALRLSHDSNQVVGPKSDYYVTLDQLGTTRPALASLYVAVPVRGLPIS